MSWTADRDDPRVKAALKRRCPIPAPICGAPPGHDCTTVGIVHLMRVPETALFAQESA